MICWTWSGSTNVNVGSVAYYTVHPLIKLMTITTEALPIIFLPTDPACRTRDMQPQERTYHIKMIRPWRLSRSHIPANDVVGHNNVYESTTRPLPAIFDELIRDEISRSSGCHILRTYGFWHWNLYRTRRRVEGWTDGYRLVPRIHSVLFPSELYKVNSVSPQSKT